MTKRMLLGLLVVAGITFSACSEPILLDPGGVPVFDPDGDVLGGAGPVRLRGAPECGADTVAVVEIDYPLGNLDPGETRTYVRDPDGALPPEIFEAPYDFRGSLENDARFTGYETDAFTVWIGADSDLYIYMVDGPRVEAWPQVINFDC